MDPRKALDFAPPQDWARIRVVDSHAGGEPFRVIIDGLPDIEGESVLERRRYAAREHDHLRKILMWEPRGHADMYGGILGPPERDDSDLSVLFIHNEGFSTMCGHGIIALCKVVLDMGMIDSSEDQAILRIDTPAGQIVATSLVRDGRVQKTSFLNVPSFVAALDASVDTPTLGTISYDLAYGGAFYAYVDAPSIGLSLDDTSNLIAFGREIKRAVAGSAHLSHPDSDDLGFLYGVMFTGPSRTREAAKRNVCVFADGEIDRSPTGTGVSGHVAILAARSDLEVGETVTVESIVGSRFEGRLVSTTTVGELPAVIPEVTGTAHLTGTAEFWVDPNDEIGGGFLIR